MTSVVKMLAFCAETNIETMEGQIYSNSVGYNIIAVIPSTEYTLVIKNR